VGHKYRGLFLQVGGLTQDWRPCSVKIIVVKSKVVKTGCNLEESSKESYGSKGALLPMRMMMYYYGINKEKRNRGPVASMRNMSNARSSCKARRCLSVNLATYIYISTTNWNFILVEGVDVIRTVS
jgi:hypothetical protein